MLTAWRLVRKKYAAAAFTGQGAADHGGRWNSQGTPVVYTSGSMSLAALETLVHLPRPATLQYVTFKIEIDPRFVQKLPENEIPKDWEVEPPGPLTMSIGDAWVKDGRSAVLEVPSVIIPQESNYLLNPRHPDFTKLGRGKSQAFYFDPRLLLPVL